MNVDGLFPSLPREDHERIERLLERAAEVYREDPDVRPTYVEFMKGRVESGERPWVLPPR